jgi:hypothetical protein
MYCSSCGVAVGKGLSYCNYCGAKLSSTDTEAESREVRPGLLVSAMAGIFVLGLPGIAFIVFMLNAALRLDPQQTMAFAWAAFFLLIALEVVFLTLLLIGKVQKDKSRRGRELPGSQTKELEERYAGSPAEPVSGVTEHTTRAFDAIPRQRN